MPCGSSSSWFRRPDHESKVGHGVEAQSKRRSRAKVINRLPSTDAEKNTVGKVRI